MKIAILTALITLALGYALNELAGDLSIRMWRDWCENENGVFTPATLFTSGYCHFN